MSERYDVIIVGGGAAGLSAALVLGRCRRRIRLYDDGQHRNAAAPEIHCLLGQEGTPPRDFYATARAELGRYETVTLYAGHVTQITPRGNEFSVTCADGSTVTARKILLATGLKDFLPELEASRPFMAGARTIALIVTASSIATNPSPSMGRGTKVRAWR